MTNHTDRAIRELLDRLAVLAIEIGNRAAGDATPEQLREIRALSDRLYRRARHIARQEPKP